MSRQELIGRLFHIVSEDADGTMKRDEFNLIIESYAQFLDVNLKLDWKKIVDRWFQQVSNGDGVLTL